MRVRGTWPENPALAIVGTRTPRPPSLAMARRLATAAVGAGYGVVAGLAAGIDTAAHEACLDAGGRTWAFVGSGVDVPENPDLADRIVATGGGILSEQPDGTAGTAETRRLRDRFQVDFSSAIVIVETHAGDGTLHTARYALERGKPVFVVARSVATSP